MKTPDVGAAKNALVKTINVMVVGTSIVIAAISLIPDPFVAYVVGGLVAFHTILHMS